MITMTTLASTIDAFHDSPPDGCSIEDLTPMLLFKETEEAIHADACLERGYEFLIQTVGAEHDYQHTLKLEYVNDDDKPAWADPVRHQEFADAVIETCAIPEMEPVRFFVFAMRLPDFSVATIVMEVDGETHDSVSAPMFMTFMRSALTCNDSLMGAVTCIARHFWGKAWEPLRCHHNKRPGPGAGGFMMPMPDGVDGD